MFTLFQQTTRNSSQHEQQWNKRKPGWNSEMLSHTTRPLSQNAQNGLYHNRQYLFPLWRFTESYIWSWSRHVDWLASSFSGLFFIAFRGTSAELLLQSHEVQSKTDELRLPKGAREISDDSPKPCWPVRVGFQLYGFGWYLWIRQRPQKGIRDIPQHGYPIWRRLARNPMSFDLFLNWSDIGTGRNCATCYTITYVKPKYLSVCTPRYCNYIIIACSEY